MDDTRYFRGNPVHFMTLDAMESHNPAALEVSRRRGGQARRRGMQPSEPEWLYMPAEEFEKWLREHGK